MKRKITRASIDELRKEMPVLTVEQQSEVIGGGGRVYYIDSQGYWYSSGITSDDCDYIDIYGNRFAISGSINLDINAKGLQITGSGANLELSQFFASNTCVEWALCCNQYQTDANGTLNTSHRIDGVDQDAYGGGKYNAHIHNHPYNNTPSGLDLNAKKELQKKGYEYFFIYRNGEYHPY